MELIINKDEATPISDFSKGKKGFTSSLGKLAINKANKRNNNPIVPGAADFVQWVAYDRMTYAAATILPNLISYFSIPSNQSGKTKMDTNLTQSQTFPAPNWLNVVGLTVYFADTMLKNDISIVLNNFWLEFWCQEKIYVEGPLYNFPSVGGLTSGINSTLAAGAQISAYNNGTPAAFNFFDVRLPAGMQLGTISTDGVTGIVINGGQSFHVDLKSTAAAATITLGASSAPYGGYLVTVSLLGTYSRAVQ